MTEILNKLKDIKNKQDKRKKKEATQRDLNKEAQLKQLNLERMWDNEVCWTKL